ncbi:MAG: heme biosynthesis protein HemY [Gammaproteobacteria bacterium]|nr:heme biosynthesis protein HemY [Gammaproteobacteria bacterium]
MKLLVLFLSVLLLFVWLGLQIQADPGYVLLAYHQWTVETPLWFAIASVVLAFILLHLFLRLLTKLSGMTTRWRLWAKQRRLRRAHERTSRGLIELAEGRWQTAEKNLLKAAQDTDMPLINYLSAARAAQELGEDDRRDDYLHKAHSVMPSAEIAVGLTQAQLQLNHHQLEQSLATLRRLHDLAPRHAYILKLLQGIYLDLQDYDNLEALSPSLKKAKVLTPFEYASLQQKIYLGLLQQAEKGHDPAAVESVWYRMPKELHHEPGILIQYVRYLMKTHQATLAEQLLQTALKKKWDTTLVTYYGLLESEDAQKQLQHAEYWLKLHPEDPALLLCLGRLCIRNQLWGKARSYLETCIALAPSAEAYATLAQLLEKMGEQTQANQCYRKGLLLVQRI